MKTKSFGMSLISKYSTFEEIFNEIC